jgi:phosphoribosyl-ATP pyrophosphohydrolase
MSTILDNERLIYEVADLLYHTLVLLAYHDIELTKRFKLDGKRSE